MAFTKATKTQRKAHIALIGPTGSGKTLTALKMAQRLLEPGKRIAVIDTENASASLYSDDFDFDTCQLESFHPREYVRAIREAEAAGYGVLVIDSLSHAWAGKDGVLEMVDNAAKRSGNGSTFGAWRDATPEHNDLVEALVRCGIDLIVTMRSKMAYVQEKDEKTGKTVVRKVGMQPVQREGLEYEFDLIADMDTDHHFIVGKTRCSAMDGVVALKPSGDIIEPFRAWLRDGALAPERPATPPPAPAGRDEPRPSPAPSNGNGSGRTSAPKASSEAQHRKLYAIAGKVHLDADAAKALLDRLYGAKSAKDLTSQQASDLIQRLEAIEQGKASIADLTGAEAREPGDDTDDPITAVELEISDLCRQAGITDPERRQLIERAVKSRPEYEAVKAYLAEEIKQVAF